MILPLARVQGVGDPRQVMGRGTAGLLLVAAGCFSEGGSTSGADDGATSAMATTAAATGASEATTAPGSASGSATTESGDDADTTAGTSAGPMCGDGNVDPGEACDDGDDDDANGCTRTCVESGSQLWLNIYGGGMGDQRANDVAFDPAEDAFYVVGHRGLGTTIEVWQAKLDAAGEVEFDNVIADPANNGYAFGVDVAPGGGYVYAGYTDPAGDIFIRHADPDGTLLASVSHGGVVGQQDTAYGIAAADDGTVLAVGREAFSGSDYRRFLRASAANLTDVIWSESTGPSPGTARGVAWSVDTGAFVVAGYEALFAEAWVRAYDLGGTMQWETLFAEANETVLSGIAVSADTVFACGWELAGDPIYRGRLIAFDITNGDVRWDESWDGLVGEGAYCSDVAVDAQGQLVTVGATLVAGSEDPTPIVRKRAAADGQLLWETVVSDPAAPIGYFQGVSVGADNTIVAVGHAGGSKASHVPIVAGLAP